MHALTASRILISEPFKTVIECGVAFRLRYTRFWADYYCPAMIKSIFVYPFTAFSLPERDTICTTMSFLALQNANEIKIVNQTEQFLYTMIAFLGKENTFLDADVNQSLSKFVRGTFNDPKSFNFDAHLNRNLFFFSILMSPSPMHDLPQLTIFILLQRNSILKICTFHFWISSKAAATVTRYLVHWLWYRWHKSITSNGDTCFGRSMCTCCDSLHAPKTT